MKISTKGRYGLRALVDLSAHSSDGNVTLVSIAQRQKISLNYLEQVFSILRRAGIVKSIKGSQGGYILTERPENIKAADIIKVLEGEFSIIEEVPSANEEKDGIKKAISRLVWEKINESVNQYMESITLEELAEDYKKRNNFDCDMYYI